MPVCLVISQLTLNWQIFVWNNVPLIEKSSTTTYKSNTNSSLDLNSGHVLSATTLKTRRDTFFFIEIQYFNSL